MSIPILYFFFILLSICTYVNAISLNSANLAQRKLVRCSSTPSEVNSVENPESTNVIAGMIGGGSYAGATLTQGFANVFSIYSNILLLR
jgi:hypothetical protein